MKSRNKRHETTRIGPRTRTPSTPRHCPTQRGSLSGRSGPLGRQFQKLCLALEKDGTLRWQKTFFQTSSGQEKELNLPSASQTRKTVAKRGYRPRLAQQSVDGYTGNRDDRATIQGKVSSRARPQDSKATTDLDEPEAPETRSGARRSRDQEVANKGVSADKKNAAARGATLVFLDESGFSLTPTVRRTFAPKGKTPICRCRKWGGKISAISVVTLSPKQKRTGLYFDLLPDNKNVEATNTVRFLKELKRHLPKKLTIIWDRSKVHDRANEVKAFLAKHPEIVTEKFPAYAPELNPDEGVWTYTKYGRLANYAPTNTTDLRTRLTDELDRLAKRHDLLASFILQTNLPLKL